jgi:hypothetical protein
MQLLNKKHKSLVQYLKSKLISGTKKIILMDQFSFSISTVSRQKSSFAILLFVSLLGQSNAFSQRASLASRQKQQVVASSKDASPSVLQQFNSIITKYNLSSKKDRSNFSSKITEADRVKLESLYTKMSKKQQASQVVGFMPKPQTLSETVPTNKQLEEWENAKVYGVWIDGKKVENNTLNDYSYTDFSHYGLSKLSKNALNNGKYYYQVNLMTKEYYQEYVSEAKANKGRNIMIVKEP